MSLNEPAGDGAEPEPVVSSDNPEAPVKIVQLEGADWLFGPPGRFSLARGRAVR